MRYSELEETLERIEHKLDHLHREVRRMAVDQETFDAELAALVQAIVTLNEAVDAFIASKPAADFTAEETLVQQAAQAVSDELAKITPPPADTTGADTPPEEPV